MRTREKSKIMSDKVNHPQHYQGKFEVWDVLDDWFPNNPTLWQVGKYIARADRKGAPLEDLKKARVYLEREIEKREKPEPSELGAVSIGPTFLCTTCARPSQAKSGPHTYYCGACGFSFRVP